MNASTTDPLWAVLRPQPLEPREAEEAGRQKEEEMKYQADKQGLCFAVVEATSAREAAALAAAEMDWGALPPEAEVEVGVAPQYDNWGEDNARGGGASAAWVKLGRRVTCRITRREAEGGLPALDSPLAPKLAGLATTAAELDAVAVADRLGMALAAAVAHLISLPRAVGETNYRGRRVTEEVIASLRRTHRTVALAIATLSAEV